MKNFIIIGDVLDWFNACPGNQSNAHRITRNTRCQYPVWHVFHSVCQHWMSHPTTMLRYRVLFAAIPLLSHRRAYFYEYIIVLSQPTAHETINSNQGIDSLHTLWFPKVSNGAVFNVPVKHQTFVFTTCLAFVARPEFYLNCWIQSHMISMSHMEGIAHRSVRIFLNHWHGRWSDPRNYHLSQWAKARKVITVLVSALFLINTTIDSISINFCHFSYNSFSIVVGNRFKINWNLFSKKK